MEQKQIFGKSLFELGFSMSMLTEQYNQQSLSQIASLIRLQSLNEKDLVKIADQLFPHITKPNFTVIWLELLNKLSSVKQSPHVQNVFTRLSEKQSIFPKCDAIPKDLLRHLWLCHLPSLELAVLQLFEVTVDDKVPPDILIEHLEHNILFDLCREEPVIQHAVASMLNKLSQEVKENTAVIKMRQAIIKSVRMNSTSVFPQEYSL